MLEKDNMRGIFVSIRFFFFLYLFRMGYFCKYEGYLDPFNQITLDIN